jgi:protein tyrosine phosphatase
MDYKSESELYNTIILYVPSTGTTPNTLIKGAFKMVFPIILLRRYKDGKIPFSALFSNWGEIEKYLPTHKVIIVANESSDNKLIILKEYLDEKKITYTFYHFDEFVKSYPDKVESVSKPLNLRRFSPGSPSTPNTPLVETMGKISKIIPGLFLSGLDAITSESLTENEISKVLRVMKNPPPLPTNIEEKKIEEEKIEIDDTFGQNIGAHFEKVYEMIDEALKNNQNILVHCRAGISRSATIVISYIMKSQRMKMDDAFEFVKSKRSIISPNGDFFATLYKYERELNL